MSELPNEDIAAGLAYVIDKGLKEEPLRHYLGMSQLGNSCGAALWHYFRWTYKPKFEHRKMRIFQAGHDSEAIIIKELDRIGVRIQRRQETLKHADGYILGHTDGYTTDIPELEEQTVLLEAKSMKDAKWKSTVLNGVKIVYKEYWCQSQSYGSKIKAIKALFVFLNKDTSELHFELVDVNNNAADMLLTRGEDIVYSLVPPKRVSEDPEWFECGWCDAKEVCHENKNFEKNCRTCQNVIMTGNGEWGCKAKNKMLTIEEQREGCKDNFQMLAL